MAQTFFPGVTILPKGERVCSNAEWVRLRNDEEYASRGSIEILLANGRFVAYTKSANGGAQRGADFWDTLGKGKTADQAYIDHLGKLGAV